MIVFNVAVKIVFVLIVGFQYAENSVLFTDTAKLMKAKALWVDGFVSTLGVGGGDLSALKRNASWR